MVIRHLILKQDFLNKVMVRGTMSRSMKTVLLLNIHMEDLQILNRLTLRLVLNLVTLHRSSMASHHYMACQHRDSLHNLMLSPDLLNQGIYRIKVPLLPSHMAPICQLNNHTHMHLGHHKQHILVMGLHQLQMATVTHHLHLVHLIPSLVDNPAMASQLPSLQPVMHRLVPLVMGHTQLHSKVTPSSRLPTTQFMATKHPKILLITVVLHQYIVQPNQVHSQVMFNPHQLKLVMNNLTHNQLVMQLYQQVLPLRMARQCRPSLLLIPNMIPPKFMVLLDDVLC